MPGRMPRSLEEANLQPQGRCLEPRLHPLRTLCPANPLRRQHTERLANQDLERRIRAYQQSLLSGTARDDPQAVVCRPEPATGHKSSPKAEVSEAIHRRGLGEFREDSTPEVERALAVPAYDGHQHRPGQEGRGYTYRTRGFRRTGPFSGRTHRIQDS